MYKPLWIVQKLALVFALVLFPGFILSHSADAENNGDTIVKVQFKGNKTTKSKILSQEMVIFVGDKVDHEKIEQSRQAIYDLELFQSVKTVLLPHPKGKILQISVEEKYYILPLPKLGRTADGDIYYGGALELNNLGGLNQNFELAYEIKDLHDSYINEEKTLEIDYDYPRIAGSPYQLVLAFENSQKEIEKHKGEKWGLYLGELSKFKLSLGYWLNNNGPSKGWLVAFGLLRKWMRFDHQEGITGLYYDTNVNALAGRIFYDGVRNLPYNRYGLSMEYCIDWSNTVFESALNYHHHKLTFRRYFILPWPKYTNLNMQLRLAYASDTLYDDPAFQLGSSSTLRGFQRESFPGNVYFLLNTELLSPIWKYKFLRGVVFLDMGNAYPHLKKIDLFHQEASGGLGLRWKVHSFVRMDLRLDIAHSITDKDFKIYLGTKAMF